MFLVVTPPGGTAPCIADPTFRSNFQLSEMHTTATYAAALPACECSSLLQRWVCSLFLHDHHRDVAIIMLCYMCSTEDRTLTTFLHPAADEFVGSEARVAMLVKFLCAEMAVAFAAAGRTVPPWRAEAAMLSKWLPGRFRDEVFRPAAKAAQRSAQAASGSAKAMDADTDNDSSVGSSSSASTDADAACLGSSCSPTSPLELGGGSSGSRKQQQKVPTAAANSAQRPLAVQTGFAVPAGASLLSRELGSAALQQATTKAGGQMRRSGSNKSVHFAADALARDCSFHGSRRGVAGGCGGDAEMPAIRTVKMTGRCR